jgi:hypothetical protein
MKRIIKISMTIWIVLTMLASCRAISRFLHDDEIVAEVDDAILYKSDVEKMLPSGLSKEDSLYLAAKYIKSWASDQVFLSIAEEQLSKAEQDVTTELEAYRRALLRYRYEQLYINERLDTSVSEDKVQQYYNANKDKFVLDRPVVKVRFLSISSNSPLKDQIKKKMSSSESADVLEADSLAYIGAKKFQTWDGRWIDISTLAIEFGLDNSALLAKRKGRWIEAEDTTGVVCVAFIEDFKDKGEMAPIEYSTPIIKDMIVSVRKQDMINSLEQNLLEDARLNGKYKTY